MVSEPDIVHDVLDVVLDTIRKLGHTLTPEFQMELQAKAAAAVRKTFGGDRLYIPHGRELEQRNARIRRDYHAGERINLLERRYGLTKRQLLRILKVGA